MLFSNIVRLIVELTLNGTLAPLTKTEADRDDGRTKRDASSLKITENKRIR
jgi:hypothetical protein